MQSAEDITSNPQRISAKSITGVIPPLVTPFDPEGVMIEDALRTETRYFLAGGAHGLGFGGSTGEGALLSDDELRRGLRIVQEENAARLPLVCGIVRNATRDAIRAGLVARECGADALMVTPTFYHGADDAGNLSYFREIAAATGLPIIVYNVISQNPVSPLLMLRLAEIELVAGVKQSVGGLHGLNEMISICGDRIAVYGAQDDALFCSYLLGAAGAISAILTAFPALCVEQWDAVQAGDIARAREIHFRLQAVWRIVSEAKMCFHARLKAILALQGRPGGVARRPALAPSPEIVARLRDALQQGQLLESAPGRAGTDRDSSEI